METKVELEMVVATTIALNTPLPPNVVRQKALACDNCTVRNDGNSGGLFVSSIGLPVKVQK